MEIEAFDRMVESNKKLSKQMAVMQQQFQAAQIMDIHCGNCGGSHASEDCGPDLEEEVKVLGSNQNNPYSNTYNPGWRNHPNFSWREQGDNGQGNNFQHPYQNQRFQGQSSRQQSVQQEQDGNRAPGKKSLEKIVESFINQSQTNFMNQGAAIKNLETQVGQIAKQLAETPPGKFPSDTEVNPKENCSAITLRSGNTLAQNAGKNIENNTINNPIKIESDKAAEPASDDNNNTPLKLL